MSDAIAKRRDWKFARRVAVPTLATGKHSHAVLAVGEGALGKFFKTLADDPDNEYAMIDATIVRAHQHSAGALKKGVSTKP